MKRRFLLLLSLVFVMATGCQEDFLDTTPSEQISAEQLSTSPAALQAIMNGVYANIRTFQVGKGGNHHEDYGLMSMNSGLDLMGSDMLMARSHWYGSWALYIARTQINSRTRIAWNTYYTQVAEVNSIINAVNPEEADADAKALLGQALALRGLFTFNAVRMYAMTYVGNESDPGIPLPTGLSFEGKARAPLSEIYAQITSDLEASLPMLEGYQRNTKQEVDLSVAQGFLARVYLEMQNWSRVAELAAAARAGYPVLDADGYLGGFSDINTPSWMWGSDIDAISSTIFASFFSHFDNTNNGNAGVLSVYKNIDRSLYDLIPDSDIRKSAFVDPVRGNPTYPALPAYANIKFRDPSFFEGDYLYMRAAEMLLMEAEAKAQMGDEAGAQQLLLDLVSQRDANYTGSTASGQDLLEEIYLQRRIELWGEGVAWTDLKRLGRPVIRDYEGSNHVIGIFNIPAGDNRFRFQIPLDEINANPAINEIDQNPL